MEKTAVVAGTGNVATHLLRVLPLAGVRVKMVYSRTAAHAEEAGRNANVPFTADWLQVPADADIYFYAVSDNALPELLSRELAPGALHVHTAGSVGLDVFPAHKSHHGVLYPLQTFTKARELNFREVPLFVEASSTEDAEILRHLAGLLSDQVLEINSSQRRQLHLAAVFACNFVNHLYAIAGELIGEADVPFEVLRPLISETAAKIELLSPADAQTGPAVRRDTSVMSKHLDLLCDHPQFRDIYKLLSDSIGGIS